MLAAVLDEHELELARVGAAVELEHRVEPDQRHVLAAHDADLAIADQRDLAGRDREHALHDVERDREGLAAGAGDERPG